MKKLLSILLAILITTTLISCSSKGDDPTEKVNFYYQTKDITYHSETGLFTAEKRKVTSQDLVDIINLYLAGPENDEYRSPFPGDTAVRSITHNNGIINIVLSDEFSTLKGFDLTVACACLTITIQELAETQLVQISAENTDLDGNKSITMSTDSLVIYDALPASS